MSKTPFESFWVCPKMRCGSMLIFDSPHLPCAKHGAMVRTEDMPRKKRAYRAYRRLSQRLLRAMWLHKTKQERPQSDLTKGSSKG